MDKIICFHIVPMRTNQWYKHICVRSKTPTNHGSNGFFSIHAYKNLFPLSVAKVFRSGQANAEINITMSARAFYKNFKTSSLSII